LTSTTDSEGTFRDEEEEMSNHTTIGQGYIRSGIIKCEADDYVTTRIDISNLDTLCKLLSDEFIK